MKINFESPVNESSDVAMECQYTYDGDDNIHMEWLRQTEPNTDGTKLWSCDGDRAKIFNDTAAPGFEDRFRSNSSTLCAKGHAINLIKAQKTDEGTYWCSVRIYNIQQSDTYLSESKELKVQGEFSAPPLQCQSYFHMEQVGNFYLCIPYYRAIIMLFYLHLFTDCFMKISLQSSDSGQICSEDWRDIFMKMKSS